MTVTIGWCGAPSSSLPPSPSAWFAAEEDQIITTVDLVRRNPNPAPFFLSLLSLSVGTTHHRLHLHHPGHTRPPSSPLGVFISLPEEEQRHSGAVEVASDRAQPRTTRKSFISTALVYLVSFFCFPSVCTYLMLDFVISGDPHRRRPPWP